MALMVSRPELARNIFLRAASRQFEEGDVQHWWLPTTGQGVKTRISDNRIWLAFVVAHYLEVTGDVAVWTSKSRSCRVALCPGRPRSLLRSAPDPRGRYFEHCVRALDSSLAIGSHGLPLFGTGDWNDGMNRSGQPGAVKAFGSAGLYATLLQFAPIADGRGESDTAANWRKHGFAVQQAIEREAWDGDCTGAVTLMMGRRWGRLRATNAGSIRSPNPGR